MGQKRLIIIGAGPKAMAIAAKHSVLLEMGFAVPEIHIIEKRTVGAHWTGDSGYTNGSLALGTSPEKDVGFPYNSTCWGASYNKLVDDRMARFSWQSYLIHSETLSDWVDRGRPAPLHREWAKYLQWVAAMLPASVKIHCGEADRVHLTPEGTWEVGYTSQSGRRGEVDGDGIVVTGPGKIRMAEALPVHDNVFTVESFWRNYLRFRDVPSATIAIVGTGENAAAIAMSLASLGNPGVRVEIVSPSGMAFSRGESFRENRVYSNPDTGNWSRLTPEDRKQFIYRTDRGVFSLYAQATLDRATNVETLPGRLSQIGVAGDGSLDVELEYAGERERRNYQYVVMATGADPLAFFRGILADESRQELLQRLGVPSLTPAEIEPRIARDLSVSSLTPKLHLPMLSGIAQGPGFANLSCLGRLADRILQTYVGFP